jgi:hypothetical protein
MVLARRVRDPRALGIAYLGAGISAYMEGRWKTSWELAEKCEQIFRERCTGTAWELDTTHIYSLRALFFLGELDKLSNRLPALLKEAGERGDLFAEMSLRVRQSYLLALMSDEPVRAREELDRAVAQWSHQGFQLQHYFHLVSEAEISLYTGSATEAWEGLRQRWRALDRSLLLRTVQLFRIEAWHLRARCAIAAAGATEPGTPARGKLLQSARRDGRRIANEGTAWGEPLALLIEAPLASMGGHDGEATALLSRAESGFERNDMALYRSAARRARGLLIGGKEGRELVGSADEWMAGQKIRNAERMMSMLAPGPWATSLADPPDNQNRSGHIAKVDVAGSTPFPAPVSYLQRVLTFVGVSTSQAVVSGGSRTENWRCWSDPQEAGGRIHENPHPLRYS